MMTTTHEPSTKEDILQHLLKQGQATAQELAEVLEISPQAIRRHLKDLEAEELIRHQAVQAGMGRPQHQYELTTKGKDYFPNRYDEFAVSLLDTLAETMSEDQMGVILRKQWERKAKQYRDRLGDRPLSERVASLVKLRQAEGYMAEWHPIAPVDSEESDRFLLTEHNCAISTVAESFPSVCGHELEMFGEILPDCHVERTYWMIDGEHRCGYLITPQQ